MKKISENPTMETIKDRDGVITIRSKSPSRNRKSKGKRKKSKGILENLNNKIISLRKQEDKLIKILNIEKNPMSTRQLSKKSNMTWPITTKICSSLQAKGKVFGYRAGQAHIWGLKKKKYSSDKVFKGY